MGAYCGAVVVLHRLVFFVVRYLVNQRSEFSFDIRIKLIHDLFCLSVEPPSFDILSFLSQVWKFGVQPIFHEEIFHIIIPNRLIWICILFECTNRLVCNQSQMFKMISTEHSSVNGKKFSYQKISWQSNILNTVKAYEGKLKLKLSLFQLKQTFRVS